MAASAIGLSCSDRASSAWRDPKRNEANKLLLATSLTVFCRHCKPGGWVECQELDVDARSDDSSFPDDSAILRWCANQETAAQKAGVTLRIYGDVLEQQMRAAGFINVVVRKFKIPIGVWPADEKMREVGCAQLITMLEGLEGLTIAFWVGMLGWKPEEVSVFLAMVRNEFKSRKVHSYWPVYVTPFFWFVRTVCFWTATAKILGGFAGTPSTDRSQKAADEA